MLGYLKEQSLDFLFLPYCQEAEPKQGHQYHGVYRQSIACQLSPSYCHTTAVAMVTGDANSRAGTRVTAAAG
jgi:hypothetical protein